MHVTALAGSPRLELQDKIAILEALDSGLCSTYAEAGSLFGVTHVAVSYIVQRRATYEEAWNLSSVGPRRKRLSGDAVQGTASMFSLCNSILLGARKKRAPSTQVHYIGKMDVKCDFCGALHYPGETSQLQEIDGVRMRTFQSCCVHGKWKDDPLLYPEQLRSLLVGTHPQSAQFHQRIRNYNSAHAFASNNAETYDFASNGPYCYRVHGAVVSMFSTGARPDPPERPKYGQMYIINSDEALGHRLDRSINDGVDPGQF